MLKEAFGSMLFKAKGSSALQCGGARRDVPSHCRSLWQELRRVYGKVPAGAKRALAPFRRVAKKSLRAGNGNLFFYVVMRAPRFCLLQ